MHLNTSVKMVRHSECTLGDGSTLPFGLMVWSTGLAPIDLVRDMEGVKKERGRIAIDRRLRVPGMEGVFAMGDAAVDPESPLGPLAQVADQQGKVREHIVPFVTFGYVLPGVTIFFVTLGIREVGASRRGKNNLNFSRDQNEGTPHRRRQGRGVPTICPRSAYYLPSDLTCEMGRGSTRKCKDNR